MIIMVRDGMGWFTRWGLISYLLVDYGWSVGLKMVVAISNLSYVVSCSILARIPNFNQIGQKTQKLEILVDRKMVVAISRGQTIRDRHIKISLICRDSDNQPDIKDNIWQSLRDLYTGEELKRKE